MKLEQRTMDLELREKVFLGRFLRDADLVSQGLSETGNKGYCNDCCSCADYGCSSPDFGCIEVYPREPRG
jgi:hypothetical protein